MKPIIWRQAIRDSDLDGTAKHVAHVISTYMNGAGDTFVGKETIARGASLKSVRAVDRAVHRIENAKFISVLRTNGGRPNHYLAQTPNTPYRETGSTLHAHTGLDPVSGDTEPRTSRPPTPYRGTPEVEVLESAVQSVDGKPTTNKSHLEELLEPIGHIYPGQLRELESAYEENPLGLSRCIRDSLAGDRPAALLTSMVKEGAHRRGEAASGQRYTGARFVRGTHSGTHIKDPLGTDKPPPDWPYPPPSPEEVTQALRERNAKVAT